MCFLLILGNLMCFWLILGNFMCFLLILGNFMCFLLILGNFMCFLLILVDFMCFWLILGNFMCFLLILGNFMCFLLILGNFMCFLLILGNFMCFLLILVDFMCFWLILGNFMCFLLILGNFMCFLLILGNFMCFLLILGNFMCFLGIMSDLLLVNGEARQLVANPHYTILFASTFQSLANLSGPVVKTLIYMYRGPLRREIKFSLKKYFFISFSDLERIFFRLLTNSSLNCCKNWFSHLPHTNLIIFGTTLILYSISRSEQEIFGLLAQNFWHSFKTHSFAYSGTF